MGNPPSWATSACKPATMSASATRLATYQDLLNLPEDTYAEVLVWAKRNPAPSSPS